MINLSNFSSNTNQAWPVIFLRFQIFPALRGRKTFGSFSEWKQLFLRCCVHVNGTKTMGKRVGKLLVTITTCLYSVMVNSYSNRRVHAWRGIMGNQGKNLTKQGSKMYVFLHISVLISNLVTKHIQYAEWPLLKVTSVFESIEWMLWAHEFFFLRLKPNDLIKS